MIRNKDLLSRFRLSVADCGDCKKLFEAMCSEHFGEWNKLLDEMEETK